MVIRARNLFLLCIPLFFWACGAKQTITGVERVYRDTTIIVEKLVPIEVPGSTIQSPTINIDSLVTLLRSGVDPKVIERTLIREDPETKLKVGILIDEMGNLTALCEQQERIIETLQREITRLQSEYERVTVEVSKTWIQQLWHDFKQLIIGALLLIAFLTIRKFLT
ncbi:hypothetical protein [Algoriphagus marincola]|uniref:hypothetical protein n=1 Tax=Algoriphagus TaxID=246875 RepID=UPI0003FBF022|nr:hypothetical protein [Algoriphagus marincola]